MSSDTTAYIARLCVTSDGQPLSKSEKLVLFVLAHYHDIDRGEPCVSIDELAVDSLHTAAEIMEILQGLERKAVVQVISEPGGIRIRLAAAVRSRQRVMSSRDRRGIVDPGAIVEERCS